MMERFYQIADLGIRIIGEEQCFSCDAGILEAYQSNPIDPTLTVQVLLKEQLNPPAGTMTYSDFTTLIFNDQEAVIRYEGAALQDWQKAYLRLQRQNNRTTAQIKISSVPFGITSKIIAKTMEFEHLLAEHNGIVLHSSYINYHGRGILFTAPSGTGKSTQAALWEEYKDAELINGDRSAIRNIDGNLFVYGIPFAGSSNVRKNVKLPLAAIVYLAQAPENRLSRLTGVKAFRRIWEGCSINIWNQEDIENCSSTVMAIAQTVPIYYLECTPTLSAVETLHQELERIHAI